MHPALGQELDLFSLRVSSRHIAPLGGGDRNPFGVMFWFLPLGIQRTFENVLPPAVAPVAIRKLNKGLVVLFLVALSQLEIQIR